MTTNSRASLALGAFGFRTPAVSFKQGFHHLSTPSPHVLALLLVSSWWQDGRGVSFRPNDVSAKQKEWHHLPRVSRGTLSALICSHANLRSVTRAMGMRVPSGLNLDYILHVYCPGICVFDHLYIKFDNHWSR